MKIEKTKIPDVVIITPNVFNDERGYFFESFNQEDFNKNVCETIFVQDNESRSTYGVMRGLHFQKPPFAQAKLVRCTKGKVLDVAVDIRVGSPTYGEHVAVELSEFNKKMLFIPRGFAHGFVVLSEYAIFQYKCDNIYSPNDEGGIYILDDKLDIDWKIDKNDAILSEKDMSRCKFSEFVSPFRYF